MIKKKPTISFCIPTYNRAEIVEKTVKKILEYPDSDIEVVVVDNDSPDNTSLLLNRIKDRRLSYHKNETNIGAALNIIETFRKAKGQWVFTLSDEDRVTPEIIKKIVLLLHQETSLGCNTILGNVRNSSGPYPYYVYHNGFDYVPYKWDNKIFRAGDEALFNVGFLYRYLSGIMIRRNSLNEHIMKSFDPAVHGVAPHTVLYTYSAATGNARTCDMDFCIKSTQKAEKSHVESVDKKHYRHPDNKFMVFKYYSTVADILVEAEQNKLEIVSKLYGYYLDLCTYDWYNLTTKSNNKDYFGVADIGSLPLNQLIHDFRKKADSFIRTLNMSKKGKLFLEKLNNEKFSHFVQKRNINFKLESI